MSSVTQESDLEAFLNTATLAGTEFVAGEFDLVYFYTKHSILTNITMIE